MIGKPLAACAVLRNRIVEQPFRGFKTHLHVASPRPCRNSGIFETVRAKGDKDD
jgi:hypothetical protein